MTFDDYWNALEAAGWFEAYGDAYRAQFRESLERYWRQGPHLAANALGRPAYDTEWLAEYREAPKMVVESFARASDGHFQPQNLQYEYFKTAQSRDNWCRLSFDHAGHHFWSEFLWLSGEAEPAMLDLCNEALAEVGSPFRFFETPGDQCCYVALVRPEAFQDIKARGWLTFRELPGGGYGAPVE